MAFVRNSCSGCCPGCNNGFARVNYASLRSGCCCNGWNHWNNWNNWSNWNGCSSCNTCSNCNTCNNCSSCNHSCGCHCHSCDHSCSSSCSNTCSGASSCCDTWNHGRCGRGISSRSTCSGFGVLSSVAGPYPRGGNWWTNNIHFPFYTGPCGPCSCDQCCCEDKCCESSCCSPCCTDSCDPCGDTVLLSDDCCCHSSASFSAATPIELADGDCVSFTAGNAASEDFSVTPDGIRIHRPGAYMVFYTVHVPANEAVASRFALSLNGDRIAASALDVSANMDCTTNGYTMHALVHANGGDLLKLVSRNRVSIGASSASNVFTLSITRLP